MYYQNYEDYMRQVLGYPINDPSVYETYDYRNDQMYQDTYSEYYPEIYHLIHPMVCKVCETVTQPITKELIEKMTDEIYTAFEDTSMTVNVRVNTPKPEENRTISTSRNTSEEIRNSKARTERISKNPSSIENKEIKASGVENRESITPVETRHSNTTLRDLIKILILNRIFGNRPQPPRPPRPPFPGGPGPGMPPPRPPYPGGGRPPMGPGGRPPIIQPRDYPDYLEF